MAVPVSVSLPDLGGRGAVPVSVSLPDLGGWEGCTCVCTCT